MEAHSREEATRHDEAQEEEGPMEAGQPADPDPTVPHAGIQQSSSPARAYHQESSSRSAAGVAGVLETTATACTLMEASYPMENDIASVASGQAAKADLQDTIAYRQSDRSLATTKVTDRSNTIPEVSMVTETAAIISTIASKVQAILAASVRVEAEVTSMIGATAASGNTGEACYPVVAAVAADTLDNLGRTKTEVKVGKTM